MPCGTLTLISCQKKGQWWCCMFLFNFPRGALAVASSTRCHEYKWVDEILSLSLSKMINASIDAAIVVIRISAAIINTIVFCASVPLLWKYRKMPSINYRTWTLTVFGSFTLWLSFVNAALIGLNELELSFFGFVFAIG